ncbi:hypothetical protein AXG93_3507s1300 [Marchantia polymorpha subsp. ruderalis]|uniref:Uncharacterized protein n=1 Tax=Marchantia polymorpha subsp. ruderalis TaxID=1480154 RepID=A0A176VE85_MARPO|nr:hypothetical protein AXG93_3507s1300 [Marchantia polymorpha subsp. ruderalis]
MGREIHEPTTTTTVAMVATMDGQERVEGRIWGSREEEDDAEDDGMRWGGPKADGKGRDAPGDVDSPPERCRHSHLKRTHGGANEKHFFRSSAKSPRAWTASRCTPIPTFSVRMEGFGLRMFCRESRIERAESVCPNAKRMSQGDDWEEWTGRRRVTDVIRASAVSGPRVGYSKLTDPQVAQQQKVHESRSSRPTFQSAIGSRRSPRWQWWPGI